MKESEFNDMQLVKRKFFALRNGVIADTLRKAGSPFHIIFGLNLPQLVEVAAEVGKSNNLAERLWQNNSTRESMLLAPMLVEAENFSEADAVRWIETAKAEEVVDVLCLKLLKSRPYAHNLIATMYTSDVRIMRYAAIRLMWNLVSLHTADIYKTAKALLEVESDKSLRINAQRLVEECEWLLTPGL